jgi:small subunit ribosomal protein S20
VPRLRSAKKRMRQSRKLQVVNRARRSRVKTQVKKVLQAISGGDRGAAEQQLRAAAKLLDQTAAKGTIHRNAAARKKSRLAKRLAAMPAGPGS